MGIAIPVEIDFIYRQGPVSLNWKILCIFA